MQRSYKPSKHAWSKAIRDSQSLGEVVEKVPVVRDGDDSAVVAGEEVLEPVDGLEV
jgi:hypothetical protein